MIESQTARPGEPPMVRVPRRRGILAAFAACAATFAFPTSPVPAHAAAASTRAGPPSPAPADPVAVIAALFEAMARGDAATARTLLRPGGGVTSVVHRPGVPPRVRTGDWDAYLDGVTPPGRGDRERLGEAFSDEQDGLAVVWAPYWYEANGVPQHCGRLHADLVAENGVWLIQHLSWSVRTDCGA